MMESNFVTVVEATKGEQLKVSRWQYKPETALLAAGWLLISSYMTTSLSKAPRKLAALPWVQALQRFAGQPVEAGKGVSLPLPATTSTEALGAACVHCGKPRQGSHYQTGACFTSANSYSPMAQDGSNLEGEMVHTVVAIELAPAPYAGIGVVDESVPVHREMGALLNNKGCVVHAVPVEEGLHSSPVDALCDLYGSSRMFEKGDGHED